MTDPLEHLGLRMLVTVALGGALLVALLSRRRAGVEDAWDQARRDLGPGALALDVPPIPASFHAVAHALRGGQHSWLIAVLDGRATERAGYRLVVGDAGAFVAVTDTGGSWALLVARGGAGVFAETVELRRPPPSLARELAVLAAGVRGTDGSSRRRRT